MTDETIHQSMIDSPSTPEVHPSEVHFVIVRNWDRTPESLQVAASLASKLGFSVQTLTEVLSREFPTDIKTHVEKNAKGEQTEDVANEEIMVNGKLLDRLLVTLYPPAANPNLTEMTQFQSGGEVVLVIGGSGEITIAQEILNRTAIRTKLQTFTLNAGDIFISTNTPNNWTKINGDENKPFKFIYFVGNPDGPQKYSAIPKTKVKVI